MGDNSVSVTLQAFVHGHRSPAPSAGDDSRVDEVGVEQVDKSASAVLQSTVHGHRSPVPSAFPSRYAITFGETAITHVGGQEFHAGHRDAGFSVSELCEPQAAIPHSELII